MSVDKFGRHEDFLKGRINLRPPGERLTLSHDGNYDMKNKILSHVAPPLSGGDVVNLSYLTDNCLMNTINEDFDGKGKLLRNVGAPLLQDDAVNLAYLQSSVRKEIQQNFKRT